MSRAFLPCALKKLAFHFHLHAAVFLAHKAQSTRGNQLQVTSPEACGDEGSLWSSLRGW